MQSVHEFQRTLIKDSNLVNGNAQHATKHTKRMQILNKYQK